MLPFVDPLSVMYSTKVVTWFTVSLHIVIIIMIAVIFVKLHTKLQESQHQFQGAINKRNSSISLVVQLVTITISNTLSWLSSGIVFVTITFLHQYPMTIVFWTSAALVPLDAILNSGIFVLTTARKLYRS